MGKNVRSVSIDEDLDKELDCRDDLNASAIMNKLLREYLAAGRASHAALSMRLDQIERELDSARSERDRIECRIDQLKRQRDELQDEIRRRSEQSKDVVEDFAEKIHDGKFARRNIKPDNPAIQNWATEAGLTPEKFIERLQPKIE